MTSNGRSPAELAKVEPEAAAGEASAAVPATPTGNASAATKEAARRSDAAGNVAEPDGVASRNGEFGAADVPRGVRELAGAFTRNLPLAIQRERAWDQMPFGAAESFIVEVSLDDEGRVARWQLGALVIGEHPRHVKELARRAVALLGRNQFRFSGRFGAGTQRFSLRISIEKQRAYDDELADPNGLFGQGSEPPQPDRPGRAWSQRNSGRVVIMDVVLLPQ